jgi:hypothetical protein
MSAKLALRKLDDMERLLSTDEETALFVEVRHRLTKPVTWPPEPEKRALH